MTFDGSHSKRAACSCVLRNINCSVPCRNSGLPWCDAAAARCIAAAGLTALFLELQTHEAELLLAAWAQDVLAGFLVVLHLYATGGAGPDGRAGSHPRHLGQGHGVTPFQQLQHLV